MLTLPVITLSGFDCVSKCFSLTFLLSFRVLSVFTLVKDASAAYFLFLTHLKEKSNQVRWVLGR